MMYDISFTGRHHLAVKNERAAGICIPKRCSCGKACTSKQLAQHGKCVACVQTAFIATIRPDDMAKLRHMLGAVPGRYAKSRWGWRNYYLAAGASIDAMRRLAASGLVTEGRSEGAEIYFHATTTGCKAAGLDRAGITQAMKDEK